VSKKQCMTFCLTIIFLVLVSSCATSPKPQLSSVWKDEGYSGGYLRKVLVVGVARKEATREFFEDELAVRLKRHGIDAISSHEVIPSSEDLLNKAAVEAKIKGSGVDSLLITRLVYALATDNYVRPNPNAQQSYTSGIVYGDKNYGDNSVDIYAPRVTGPGEMARLGIQVYQTGAEKPIWSASAEVFFKDDLQKQLRAFINILVERLAADGLIR